MNVGILIIGMANLSGSGGAERFFADLFDCYNAQPHPKRKLFFISDDLSPLHKIGRLASHKDKQIIFKSYRHSFFYNITRNRPRIDKRIDPLRTFLTAKSLLRQLKKHGVNALQMPVYEDKDFLLLQYLDRLPGKLRPKLILNVTNAVVQDHYFDDNPKYAYHSKLNYGRLFETITLDGVYTWYRAFKDFAETKKVIRSNPKIHAVSSRFTSTAFFEDFSNRENKIIFSGRLSEYKDPLLFVQAAEYVNNKLPGHGWKFEMYGKGPLEKEVRSYITEHQLNSFLSLDHTPDMPSVLRRSKIYVSTQNAENFPSLAMAEAMACSNLIIARNVGQTDYYVKNNINGFLLQGDTASELGEILIKIIKSPAVIEPMAKESIALLKNVHNKENFIKEIDNFWDSINQ